jgi:hypothetical protein
MNNQKAKRRRDQMSEALVTAFISAAAILSGAAIGASCSFYISKKNTNKNIEVQNRIFEENKRINEECQKKSMLENANIIRLDICTAIFQSIRSFKSIVNNNGCPIYIPINNQYSKILVSLIDNFDLKEMSYIYQLYGIIEKINYDIKLLDYTDSEKYELLKVDYEIFLKKIYGNNFSQIMQSELDYISFEDLIDNEIIRKGYRNSLLKLNNICKRK